MEVSHPLLAVQTSLETALSTSPLVTQHSQECIQALQEFINLIIEFQSPGIPKLAIEFFKLTVLPLYRPSLGEIAVTCLDATAAVLLYLTKQMNNYWDLKISRAERTSGAVFKAGAEKDGEGSEGIMRAIMSGVVSYMLDVKQTESGKPVKDSPYLVLVGDAFYGILLEILFGKESWRYSTTIQYDVFEFIGDSIAKHKVNKAKVIELLKDPCPLGEIAQEGTDRQLSAFALELAFRLGPGTKQEKIVWADRLFSSEKYLSVAEEWKKSFLKFSTATFFASVDKALSQFAAGDENRAQAMLLESIDYNSKQYTMDKLQLFVSRDAFQSFVEVENPGLSISDTDITEEVFFIDFNSVKRVEYTQAAGGVLAKIHLTSPPLVKSVPERVPPLSESSPDVVTINFSTQQAQKWLKILKLRARRYPKLTPAPPAVLKSKRKGSETGDIEGSAPKKTTKLSKPVEGKTESQLRGERVSELANLKEISNSDEGEGATAIKVTKTIMRKTTTIISTTSALPSVGLPTSFENLPRLEGPIIQEIAPTPIFPQSQIELADKIAEKAAAEGGKLMVDSKVTSRSRSRSNSAESDRSGGNARSGGKKSRREKVLKEAESSELSSSPSDLEVEILPVRVAKKGGKIDKPIEVKKPASKAERGKGKKIPSPTPDDIQSSSTRTTRSQLKNSKRSRSESPIQESKDSDSVAKKNSSKRVGPVSKKARVEEDELDEIDEDSGEKEKEVLSLEILSPKKATVTYGKKSPRSGKKEIEDEESDSEEVLPVSKKRGRQSPVEEMSLPPLINTKAASETQWDEAVALKSTRPRRGSSVTKGEFQEKETLKAKEVVKDKKAVTDKKAVKAKEPVKIKKVDKLQAKDGKSKAAPVTKKAPVSAREITSATDLLKEAQVSAISAPQDLSVEGIPSHETLQFPVSSTGDPVINSADIKNAENAQPPAVEEEAEIEKPIEKKGRKKKVIVQQELESSEDRLSDYERLAAQKKNPLPPPPPVAADTFESFIEKELSPIPYNHTSSPLPATILSNAIAPPPRAKAPRKKAEKKIEVERVEEEIEIDELETQAGEATFAHDFRGTLIDVEGDMVIEGEIGPDSGFDDSLPMEVEEVSVSVKKGKEKIVLMEESIVVEENESHEEDKRGAESFVQYWGDCPPPHRNPDEDSSYDVPTGAIELRAGDSLDSMQRARSVTPLPIPRSAAESRKGPKPIQFVPLENPVIRVRSISPIPIPPPPPPAIPRKDKGKKSARIESLAGPRVAGMRGDASTSRLMESDGEGDSSAIASGGPTDLKGLLNEFTGILLEKAQQREDLQSRSFTKQYNTINKKTKAIADDARARSDKMMESMRNMLSTYREIGARAADIVQFAEEHAQEGIARREVEAQQQKISDAKTAEFQAAMKEWLG